MKLPPDVIQYGFRVTETDGVYALRAETVYKGRRIRVYFQGRVEGGDV